MGLQRITVRYEGRVQGVGFRYTVRHLAARRAVTGFVRNEPDGDVSLVAEGPPEEVNALLRSIQNSDLAPFIRKEHRVAGPATGEFERFEIRY